MNNLKKLEKMAEVYLAPFGLVVHRLHPDYWGSRCVLEMQYAYKVSESENHIYDDLVFEAIEYAWSVRESEGAITASAVKEVERILAPIGKKAKSLSLICVGHAHIDMNWMWGYHETVSITIDTFRTVLELMEEYPQFTFAQSQASVYKIIERHCPEMIGEIKRRVHEGRWEVTASTWVEADRNMPNLESMARHLLYTKQYLGELLEIDPATLDIDYEPDTFGHNLNVPEALNNAGVKYYYHCRGYDGHILYNWEAPSGKSILVYREPTWYIWTMDGRCALSLPEFCKKHNLKSMLRVYGIGDHGGGPTRRDIEKIIDMNTWPIFPEYRFGTYGQFYKLAERNKDEFPVVKGELNFIFDGCYTTQTRQKKANRLSEAALKDAEGLAVLAGLATGAKYDKEAFDEAWQKVMFNQFHDILPGSGVIDTREYAMGQYQEVFAATSTHLAYSLRAISDAVDTSGFSAEEDIRLTRSEGAGVGYGMSDARISQTGRHAGKRRLFTVYNPLPFEREELTRITVWDWDGNSGRMLWQDCSGNRLCHQVLANDVKQYWGHMYIDVLVKVRVPAMGYTTILLDEAYPETISINVKDPRVENPKDIILENDLIKAVLDPRDGSVVSLVDKSDAKELVKPESPACIFRLVEEDTIRGMSSWTVGRYMSVSNLNKGIKFKKIDLGSHLMYQSVNYELDFSSGSSLSVTISLHKDEAILRFDAKARWQEIGRQEAFYPQLNFFLPISYEYSKVRYDVPMGAIERHLMDLDVPAQSYGMPVNGQGKSLMLISDCKYGYRATKDGLSLTLIRSSVDPDPWPEIGEHKIRMAIAITDGCRMEADKTAQAFNHSFIVAASKQHKGILPLTGSLLEVSGNVVLSAVKISEDLRGMIVRYYEIDGKAGTGIIKLFKKPTSAIPVSILEHPCEGEAELTDCGVRFEYAPYSVGNLLIRFD